MKKMTLILFLISFILGLKVTSQTQTYIPDDAFEQALIDLGLDTGPLDNNVPTDNINSVTSLNVINKSINDLTGIKDFTALLSLSCGNNSISELDLSTNTALSYLACDSNNLNNLDLSANTTLNQLYCNNNNISSLDLSNNTALTTLFCNDNELTSLNIKNGNNTNFTIFSIKTNPNLMCVEVDNVNYSNTNWTNKDATASYSLNCSLSIDKFETEKFKVYPNPVENVLNIELEDETSVNKVNIYNCLGKLVSSTNYLKIDTSHLLNGLYVLELETEQGKFSKKIIVQ